MLGKHKVTHVGHCPQSQLVELAEHPWHQWAQLGLAEMVQGLAGTVQSMMQSIVQVVQGMAHVEDIMPDQGITLLSQNRAWLRKSRALSIS